MALNSISERDESESASRLRTALPLSLLSGGCLTAITLLAVLVKLLLPVVAVLCVLASLVDMIASCVVSNKPFAS